jgi:ATP-binding cassette subfamily C (CFTR/MRP) protein 1
MKLILSILFVLHVLFTAFQVQTFILHTKLSVTSGVLNIIATLAAALLSFIEDQRSVEPSNILVIYFSASSILALPRLRSLWIIPSTSPCRGLWTTIFIFTVAMVFLESARKTRLLRPLYHSVTKEQICGFWGRSLFIWVLPFFQVGYSKVLQPNDMPEVDDDLRGEISGKKLEPNWEVTKNKSSTAPSNF